MPAVDALHMRTTLAEQFKNPKFRGLVDSYADLQGEQFNRPLGRDRELFGSAAFGRALSAAETFYVAPDMHKLAQLASEDFPLDETVLKSDQPSEGGFIYLPQRFRMFELRGRLVVVHACLWLNNKIWLLTDRTDPDDEISAEMRSMAALDDARFMQQLGRYDISGLIQFGFGSPIPTHIAFRKSVLPPEAHVEFKRDDQGNVLMFTDHVIDNTNVPEPTPDPFLQFMLSIWRLMQQTLADVRQDNDIPRAARRRAERVHVPTGVSVIQLRRHKGQYEGSGESINYRTLVRGHWRRVWCGPMNGERYQRAVYVHPFIRGPEDAPLIIRERVNALVR